MAKVLDARAAALEIRGKMQQPSAEDRHINAFVEKVLDELGLERTAPNAVMVGRALYDADIQPHQIVEYPKAVTVKVVDEKKYGDDKEHDEVHVVHNEDDEHYVLEHKTAPSVTQSEYPKSIRVRGTDGNMRTQLVRDLKEERELLGVGASAIDPEASTQYKKTMLDRPTPEEIDVADATENRAAMQKDALDRVNEPKVGAGTNLSEHDDPVDRPTTEEVDVADDHHDADEAPPAPKPAPPPVRSVPRPPPKRL